MTADHDNIVAARAMFEEARANLADALIEECPGPHKPVQHRDFKPAWCEACGYAEDGTRILARIKEIP